MKRKSGIAVCLLLFLCVLCSCNKEKPDQKPTPTVTPGVNSTATPVPTIPDLTHTVAPIQTTELPIYSINSDLTEVEAVTALVPAESVIDENMVAEAVVDALADNAIFVKVNKVVKKDAVVIVDFDGTTPPVIQVGASIEGLILDAFGQSILDNVDGCKGVGFSVNDGPYVSGHFEFKAEEVYMRR